MCGLVGVFCAKIHPTGIFKNAGVKEGDLVLSFDGYVLDRFGDAEIADQDGNPNRLNVYDLSERLKLGKHISIDVWRSGKTIKLETSFHSLPDYPIRTFHDPVREGVGFEAFVGLVVMQLTLNHVRDLSAKTPKLARFLSPEDMVDSKLIVSSVLGQWYLSSCDCCFK